MGLQFCACDRGRGRNFQTAIAPSANAATTTLAISGRWWRVRAGDAAPAYLDVLGLHLLHELRNFRKMSWLLASMAD